MFNFKSVNSPDNCIMKYISFGEIKKIYFSLIFINFSLTTWKMKIYNLFEKVKI